MLKANSVFHESSYSRKLVINIKLQIIASAWQSTVANEGCTAAPLEFVRET